MAPLTNVHKARVAVFRKQTYSLGQPRSYARVNRLIPLAVNKEEVLQTVRTVIAEQLATQLDTVTSESKFVDLGADSLDTVEIMMELEEKFNIQLDEEGAEKITTVGEAADIIAEKVEKTA